MAVDRDFILRSLKRIAKEEEDKLLRELAGVDSMFSKASRLNSPSWRMERERVAAAGVDCAGARMMTQVRTAAGQDAPTLADEAGTWVARLGNSLVNNHRERLTGGRNPGVPLEIEQSCQRLADALREVHEKVVDELRHTPVSPATAPASLAGRDINITAGGHVAMGGRDAVQHVEGLDIGALLAVLLHVRQAFEASQIAVEQREALTDQVAAIEAIAQQPKPDQGRLHRMVKRLWTEVKPVGVVVATSVLEGYIKQHMGLP